PVSTYSISYDIFTRATEDDAPAGWHSRRSVTYRQIKRRLAANGFVRDQYSNWLRFNTTAPATYVRMVMLESILPEHKISSTIRRLRMAKHDSLNLMDVTASIRLGGAWNNSLRGPVPSGLVGPVQHLINPVPVAGVPPGTVLPPIHSRPGGASLAVNYL
ncbi:hypothetical protein C8R47DRAFT_958720, partial [Mycena vitilis]